jgi:hypothetical protein
VDDHFHLWLPGQDITLPCYADLWPRQFPRRPLHLWGGDQLPSPIADAVGEGREFIAHNCHEFDEWVWKEKLSPVPFCFGDTIHACRAAGLPGGLDDLSKHFLGFGKDAGNLIMRKLMTLEWGGDGYYNANTTPGNVAAVARYCVADVVVLERIYQETLGFGESDVIRVHRTINGRGVQFDAGTARQLLRLQDRATAEAVAKIEELTGGELHAGNIASVPQVKAWLKRQGVELDNLRKETVERLLSDPTEFLSELTEEDDENGESDDYPRGSQRDVQG